MEADRSGGQILSLTSFDFAEVLDWRDVDGLVVVQLNGDGAAQFWLRCCGPVADVILPRNHQAQQADKNKKNCQTCECPRHVSDNPCTQFDCVVPPLSDFWKRSVPSNTFHRPIFTMNAISG